MNRYILIPALLVIVFTSCSKHNGNSTTGGPVLTILQWAAQDTSFRLYHFALQRAGMITDSSFSSGGPFTVFAPRDSAFLSAGLTQSVLASMDVSRLRSILQYQVVKGRISSQDLTGFYSEPVLTLDTAYQPSLTKNYYGLFLNGAPSLKTDELGDGVIQETGRVVAPPTSTLMGEIDSLPELSYFAAYLRHNAWLRSALEDPKAAFQDYYTLDSLFGITVLAPTNNAFQVFGFPDTAAVQSADSVYMLGLVGHFLLAGTYFSSQYKGGFELGKLWPYRNSPAISLLGCSILPDGFTFQSSSTIKHTVHIIKSDIVATNGVIQELDYMLTNNFQ